MARIVPLREVSSSLIEALLDRAFGDDRKGRTAYRLREGTRAIDPLSFAALAEDGTLAGTIQCWPVQLAAEDGDAVPLVMVGPVAVEPEVQQAGIGKALMNATLEAAATPGTPALMMIGDPEYYGRFFGFMAEFTAHWIIDGPVERRRLLALSPSGAPLPRHGRILPRPGS